MEFPLLKNTTKGQNILIFIILLLFGTVFGSLLGMVINMIVGVGIESITGLSVLQVCSQLFMFIFPPLAFVAMTKRNPVKSLGFNKIPLWSLIAIAVMYIDLPLISSLSLWNDSWKLPENMSTLEDILRRLQDESTLTMEKLLSVNGVGNLILNLIMIAGLAAFGEEMLFRSLLQPFFVKAFKNVHLGIIVTAIIFSAAHFEFYGFVPRIVLGMILGYSFYLSGTIWLPMILHFINNATIVVICYMNANGITNIDEEKFGSTDNILVLIGSIIMILAIFILMNRFRKKKADDISQNING